MKYNHWQMLINYYVLITIKLLLPFQYLECKGYNSNTSFPQHGDNEGVETVTALSYFRLFIF